MSNKEPTIVYAVITTSTSVSFKTVFAEAVFSTYDQAEEYINQFFEDAKHMIRTIVELPFNPLEDEIKNKNYFYLIIAFVEDESYHIEVNKTSDVVDVDAIACLIEDGPPSDSPEFCFYCFAKSSHEAFQIFEPHFVKFLKDNNTKLPVGEPQYDLKKCYY